MYRRILIATDGSELAGKAVAHGLALAKDQNASVVAVAVTEPWSSFEMAHDYDRGEKNPISRFEALAAEAAKKILGKVADAAKSQGVACEQVHVPDMHPAEGIVATAKEKGCDLIVMASHGRRGVGRLLLGSQAYEVLTHSKVPTMIVR